MRIRNHQNGICNYLGPYAIEAQSLRCWVVLPMDMYLHCPNQECHSGIMSCLPAIKLSGKPGATDDKKL